MMKMNPNPTNRSDCTEGRRILCKLDSDLITHTLPVPLGAGSSLVTDSRYVCSTVVGTSPVTVRRLVQDTERVPFTLLYKTILTEPPNGTEE